jgi:hypothetical protein
MWAPVQWLLWVKCLNVLSTCREWAGKPSTLMRWWGILLLLILGCVSRLATGGVWWVRVPRGVYRIACTKDCKIQSQSEEFREPLGGCPHGASHCVFRSTLWGLNQSIVGLSPLSETTYSTSHEIPNDGSWWISCLFNCIVQPCLY